MVAVEGITASLDSWKDDIDPDERRCDEEPEESRQFMTLKPSVIEGAAR